MATKKKATTTRQRKRTRKTTVVSDEAAGAEPVTDMPESPVEPAGAVERPTATHKATRKRRTANRKKKTTKKKAAVRQAAAPSEQSPSDVDEPTMPAAEVVTSGEAIVIRFPPVAASPFTTRDQERDELPPTEPTEPAGRGERVEAADAEHIKAEPAAAPAPVAEAPEPGEAAPVRKKRRRGRRRKASAPQSEPDGKVAAVVEPAEPVETPRVESAGAESPLSSSQKRRLRRKRRSERAPEEAVTEAPATAPEAEESSPATESVETADGAAPAEDKPTRRTRSKRGGRRRSGRAGRARPEISAVETEEGEATEAKEAAPTKEMIINVFPHEECRIVIRHKGKLEEIYMERASAENHVGNIYKGVVTNVESSIQAAFVDFGLGKNGFLHVSDLHPQHFPEGGAPAENVGRKMPRRNRPPIQRCLRRGQQVIVQITKEGIGTKGPTLSTYLSIPGRFVVMMPGMRRLGVSRKIEDDETRARLRELLGQLDLPDDMGFIARTAAEGRTKRELQSDLKYLVRLWRAVEKRVEAEDSPAELYRESDLVIRTIRDLYTSDIGRIVVDDPAVAKRAREFLQIFSPRSGDVVVEYDGPQPIFHKYGVEAELERLHSRHVPLKSGGSLVIDPTEALVAIDVNSGRFRTANDAETTAFKINLEAADEIARQLRLRDLGGLIICDFIDMRQESHKREVERCLVRNLKEHKERAKILRMSAFGIIEMTRQRQRASLTRSVYQDCRHCRGTGIVKTAESVTLDVMRTLQQSVIRENVQLIEIVVSMDVALLLLNRKRSLLHEFEAKYRRSISVRPDASFGLDQVEFHYWDHRGRPAPQA